MVGATGWRLALRNIPGQNRVASLGLGNVRLRDGLVVGALSGLGVLGGVAVANVLPERALQLLFAALTLFVAAQVLRRGLRQRRERLAEE